MIVKALWGIKELAEIIKKRIDNKYDCIIVFDGRRGSGKSTGALKIAYCFDEFKLKRDVVFSREDVLQSLSNKKRGIIIADEVINVIYNREHFLEDQKKLLKYLNMYRDSQNVFIACVPNWSDLDPQFKRLVSIRINVIRRGLAVLHLPNLTTYSGDPWDTNSNEKIERLWHKKNLFKPRYHKLTTFKGFIRYGALTPNVATVYEKVKEEKRNILILSDNNKDKNLKTNPYLEIYEGLKSGKIIPSQLTEIAREKNMALNSILLRVKEYARFDKADATLLLSPPESSKKYNNSDKIVSMVIKPKDI
mgnify:CR=1 FL=1